MIWQLVHFDGLMQVRRNPGALAMELRLSCTNPSSCYDNFTVRIWISLVELLCWFLLIFKASKDSEFRNFYIVLLLTWTRCWTQIWDAMSLTWCHCKTSRMMLFCCFSCVVYLKYSALLMNIFFARTTCFFFCITKWLKTMLAFCGISVKVTYIPHHKSDFMQF